MGFTREQYLQSAQKALMFFAINVALITYHKLNKSAPDGDAAAFEAAEPKSLGEQVGSFLDAVKACLLYTSPSPRDYAASRMPSSA